MFIYLIPASIFSMLSIINAQVDGLSSQAKTWRGQQSCVGYTILAKVQHTPLRYYTSGQLAIHTGKQGLRLTNALLVEIGIWLGQQTARPWKGPCEWGLPIALLIYSLLVTCPFFLSGSTSYDTIAWSGNDFRDVHYGMQVGSEGAYPV